MLADLRGPIEVVITRIVADDHDGAAEQFVETVALEPGMWATFVENASTFLDEVNDPEQLALDLEWISAFPSSSLLPVGGQSPPVFALVVDTLGGLRRNVEVATFQGAGHVPHVTHPSAYVERTTWFVERQAVQ